MEDFLTYCFIYLLLNCYVIGGFLIAWFGKKPHWQKDSWRVFMICVVYQALYFLTLEVQDVLRWIIYIVLTLVFTKLLKHRYKNQ